MASACFSPKKGGEKNMISVVVPTYNKASLLEQTLQNILEQTYKNIEIIVVDDGSTDRTREVVAKLQSEKINYFYNSKTKGTSQSRILGINQCSGSYIAFLDDDDWWDNKKLQLQHDLMIKEQLDFVMSNYIVNDLVNNTKYNVCLDRFISGFSKEIVLAPGPFLQCCLFKKEFILKNMVLFDSAAEPSEDWDWFISISKQGPFFNNIKQPLFQWNLSAISQSSNLIKETNAIEYILKKHFNYFQKNSNNQNISLQYRRLGGMFYKNKFFKKSKHYYSLAFSKHPFSIKNIILKCFYG